MNQGPFKLNTRRLTVMGTDVTFIHRSAVDVRIMLCSELCYIVRVRGCSLIALMFKLC